MKELLLKYIEGNCTDQEKVEISNWLDSSPENMNEYMALRKLYDISVWQIKPDIQAEQKSKVPLWSRKTLYVEIFKVAAIFIFALLIIRYALPEFVPSNEIAQMQTLHVPAGQRAEITLGDGTQVWLNAKTTLTFPTQFLGNKREVKLDGEGFFDVTHNKSKPFIVSTTKYDVKVWGTKFNLIAYSSRKNFETSLLEGSVEVLKEGNSNGILLKPNEQVKLRNNQLVLSSVDDMDQFLWREGIISFDNTTFSELINKLELYFDFQIEVRNPKALNYRFTGKFRMKDGVEHILKVLQIKNKFNYRIDEKLNKIIIE